MAPGPVLSKSVRKELLPVSTRPPPGFPVSVVGLRSEGKLLVIELLGPASARSFRRRMNMKAPAPSRPSARTPPPMSGRLSIRSSVQSLGGGAGFFGAAAAFGGAGFDASATLGASAGFPASVLGGSPAFGGSAFGASATFGGSDFGASAGFTSATFGASFAGAAGGGTAAAFV